MLASSKFIPFGGEHVMRARVCLQVPSKVIKSRGESDGKILELSVIEEEIQFFVYTFSTKAFTPTLSSCQHVKSEAAARNTYRSSVRVAYPFCTGSGVPTGSTAPPMMILWVSELKLDGIPMTRYFYRD
jgi:hypothetical protein